MLQAAAYLPLLTQTVYIPPNRSQQILPQPSRTTSRTADGRINLLDPESSPTDAEPPRLPGSPPAEHHALSRSPLPGRRAARIHEDQHLISCPALRREEPRGLDGHDDDPRVSQAAGLGAPELGRQLGQEPEGLWLSCCYGRGQCSWGRGHDLLGWAAVVLQGCVVAGCA